MLYILSGVSLRVADAQKALFQLRNLSLCLDLTSNRHACAFENMQQLDVSIVENDSAYPFRANLTI